MSERDEIQKLARQKETFGQIWLDAKLQHRLALLRYLGYNKPDTNTPLADAAENILIFAEAENLNPSWFFARISRAVNEVEGFSPECHFPDRLPKAQTPEQFYQYAIHNIRSQVSDLRQADGTVVKALKEAHRQAAEQEDPASPNRLSPIFHWLSENRALLYQSHGQYWRSHLEERDLVYKLPVELNPPELAEILREDISSTQDRTAQVFADNSGDSKKLIRRLQNLGYWVQGKSTEKPHGKCYKGEAVISGLTCFYFRDGIEYLDRIHQKFLPKFKEATAEYPKSQAAIYWKTLHPTTTPLTIGVQGLHTPHFINSQVVYSEGVEFGFTLKEAAKLTELGLKHNLANGQKEVSDLITFLSFTDHLRQVVTELLVSPTSGYFKERGWLYSKYDTEQNPSLGVLNQKFADFLRSFAGTAPYGKRLTTEAKQGLEQVGQELEKLPVEVAITPNLWNAAVDLLTGETSSILPNPAHRKQLYENDAYRIYGL